VSATFNVADLSPYFEDDYLVNLRANSPQQGENDGGPSKAISFTHLTSSQRSNFKSKVKEWVNLFLAQQAELSVWSLDVTPDFVTYLEQSPDEVLA